MDGWMGTLVRGREPSTEISLDYINFDMRHILDFLSLTLDKISISRCLEFVWEEQASL